MTAALAALVVPAFAGTAPADAAKKRHKTKYPTVTSVRPMTVAVGETLEIRGRNFVRGRNKNTVVFRRDGARAVFVKVPVGTAKLLRLPVPDKLQEFFGIRNGEPVSTRFRIRVLSKKFSKKFTSLSRSPLVTAPRPPSTTPPAAEPDGDCDGDGLLNRVDTDDDNDALDDATEKSLGLDPCKGDTDEDGVPDRFEFDCDRNGVLNRDQADDDSDLLSDTVETQIGTDPCNVDTDGDGVEDGYEYQSARDLNDDEDQSANTYLPYPGKRPYPNPLFKDSDVDYDGDSLTLGEEYSLWKYTYEVTKTDQRTLSPLSYSDGEQYSRSQLVATGPHTNRHQPTLSADNYDKHSQFLAWANASGYRVVGLDDGSPRWAHDLTRNNYGLFDVDRSGDESNSELNYFDYDGDGYLSDDERDEDADGLTNFDEAHGRMLPEYWSACYSMEKPYYVPYAGTSLADADSDGDGVLDGADDQDHDDIPNIMELSRYAASHYFDGKGSCTPIDDLDPKAPRHPDAYGRVNPFNPCLPAVWSRTCNRHPAFGEAGAPFDDSPTWWSLN
jgi:hypothetical protein